MSENDRGFRFLVGCFVIFTAWQLHRLGWFDLFFGSVEGETVENADIVGLLVEAIVSAVSGIGYVAILLVSGAWPAIQSLLSSIVEMLNPKDEPVERAGYSDLSDREIRILAVLDKLENHASKEEGK
ncbi:MAG: hypothetical protein ACO23H_03065 [Alphaproteobacteria bacterium]